MHTVYIYMYLICLGAGIYYGLLGFGDHTPGEAVLEQGSTTTSMYILSALSSIL